MGGISVVVVAVADAAAGGDQNNLAPILTFVGAIVVVLIGAYTANRRQDRGLNAESERQRQALRAEADRLGMQLVHDRDLADIADVRAVFDEAVGALHHAEYARQGVYAAGPAAVDAAGLASVDAAGQALDALAYRLAFRLGGDSEVVRHFTGAADALLSIRRDTGERPYLIDPLDQWRKVEKASAEFAESMSAFITAAQATAGAMLAARRGGMTYCD